MIRRTRVVLGCAAYAVYFRFQCDKCCLSGPPALSVHEARERARKLGWNVGRRTAVCPRCWLRVGGLFADWLILN